MDELGLALDDIGADIEASSIGPMLDGLLASQPTWPHAATRDYLHALAKVADDLPVLVGEKVATRPSWQLFAYMLLLARDYDSE